MASLLSHPVYVVNMENSSRTNYCTEYLELYPKTRVVKFVNIYLLTT